MDVCLALLGLRHAFLHANVAVEAMPEVTLTFPNVDSAQRVIGELSRLIPAGRPPRPDGPPTFRAAGFNLTVEVAGRTVEERLARIEAFLVLTP